MAVVRRPLFNTLTLLLGSLAVTAGGLRHPRLLGDGPTQLGQIAAATGWRAVHWAFAVGMLLVIAGLAGTMGRHAGTPGEGAARSGTLTIAVGYGVLLVPVLFMLGAGAALAQAYVEGAPGLAATHAVFVYDMLHPFAQAAVRVGALGVSLGLCVLGWAVATGGILPRWLGMLGVLGGVGGVIGAVAGAPDAPVAVLGVAGATLWQIVVAGYSFRA